jgi:hypothetical protein
MSGGSLVPGLAGPFPGAVGPVRCLELFHEASIGKIRRFQTSTRQEPTPGDYAATPRKYLALVFPCKL